VWAIILKVDVHLVVVAVSDTLSNMLATEVEILAGNRSVSALLPNSHTFKDDDYLRFVVEVLARVSHDLAQFESYVVFSEHAVVAKQRWISVKYCFECSLDPPYFNLPKKVRIYHRALDTERCFELDPCKTNREQLFLLYLSVPVEWRFLLKSPVTWYSPSLTEEECKVPHVEAFQSFGNVW
jgi:hypothetical protein